MLVQMSFLPGSLHRMSRSRGLLSRVARCSLGSILSSHSSSESQAVTLYEHLLESSSDQV